VGLVAFAVVAFVAYGFMFLDRRLNIWPAFGLDYSTHTAIALGLVIFLSFNMRKLVTFWIGSLVSYVLLMWYQRYHTIADIATTGVAVGIPIGLIMTYLYWSGRTNAANPTLNADAQNRLASR
jgi:hypothetical protein